VITLLFLGRLFQRQVFQYRHFAALAASQYYTKISEPARRGTIYIKESDSTNLVDEGQAGLFPVASDLELFNVTVIPKHLTEDRKTVAQRLSPIIGEDENKIYEAINVNENYIPPLKKRVAKEIADQVAALKIKGVYLEGQYARFYPEKESLSDLLGFVDFEGNGRYGVEEYYDGLLKGEGGTLKGLKDNLGRVVKVQESDPGKDGASLVLTIDRSIQYMVEKKLKEGIERYSAEGGTIIILEPKTGAVLAMASLPNYDPNKFNEVKTEDQSVFLNPATSLNWEPGSIFKPVVVSAALADKKVEPDSKPEQGFSNYVVVDGYEIHNSQDKAFGFETVTQILENSDNVGMVWVAEQVGSLVMGDYLKKFGFGLKTGIDLSGESAGQVAPAKKWRDVNRATISFGQGISTTPIQIAQAYAVLANKGELVKPRILDKIVEPDGEEKAIESAQPEEVIKEEDAEKIKQILISVVENGHGKKARVEGYKIAGKTGTAQIPKADGGYEEVQHIGSFAGFAPADDPRFVMLVKFDKPQNVEWAESSAAPIFGEIADWLLNSYLKVSKVENGE